MNERKRFYLNVKICLFWSIPYHGPYFEQIHIHNYREIKTKKNENKHKHKQENEKWLQNAKQMNVMSVYVTDKIF